MTATYTCQNATWQLMQHALTAVMSHLVNDSLDNNGTKIQISKCPKCQGKIKSPMCCGQDMNAA